MTEVDAKLHDQIWFERSVEAPLLKKFSSEEGGKNSGRKVDPEFISESNERMKILIHSCIRELNTIGVS